VAYFGGLINHVLQNNLFHDEYVRNYTNASFIVKDGFAFKDGLFSGYSADKRAYDIATWAYADLPKVYRPGTTARSFVVKTAADLQNALSAPNDSLIFIESIMDPNDAPAGVISGGNSGADLDYGPRGPQHRDNMLLRPAP